MPATTVLDVTQEILSGMDSDEVNSLNDTIEAQQVARFVKRAFDQIMVSNDLGWNNITFQLDSQADPDQPTHMTIPENIHQIEWIRYNLKDTDTSVDDYQEIYKLTPQDFIRRAQAKATLADNAVPTAKLIILDSLIKIWVGTDEPPRFWTTFNDKEVIFDSYESLVDDCLQSSKTACYGQIKKDLVLNDDTPIDLPPHLMDILFKTAENLAWSHLKDGVPAEMVRSHRHAEVRSQRLRYRTNQDQRNNDTSTNYGRRSAGRGRAVDSGSDSGITGPAPYYTP